MTDPNQPFGQLPDQPIQPAQPAPPVQQPNPFNSTPMGAQPFPTTPSVPPAQQPTYVQQPAQPMMPMPMPTPQQAPMPAPVQQFPQQPYGQPPVNLYAQPPMQRKMNIVALLGFIFALVPIIIIWIPGIDVLGGVMLIAGLICSIIGFNQTKHDGQNGHQFALAGIIISAILIGISIIVLIIVIATGAALLAGLVGAAGSSAYGSGMMTTAFLL
jgi:hypothetical protein